MSTELIRPVEGMLIYPDLTRFAGLSTELNGPVKDILLLYADKFYDPHVKFTLMFIHSVFYEHFSVKILDIALSLTREELSRANLCIRKTPAGTLHGLSSSLDGKINVNYVKGMREGNFRGRKLTGEYLHDRKHGIWIEKCAGGCYRMYSYSYGMKLFTLTLRKPFDATVLKRPGDDKNYCIRKYATEYTAYFRGEKKTKYFLNEEGKEITIPKLGNHQYGRGWIEELLGDKPISEVTYHGKRIIVSMHRNGLFSVTRDNVTYRNYKGHRYYTSFLGAGFGVCYVEYNDTLFPNTNNTGTRIVKCFHPSGSPFNAQTYPNCTITYVRVHRADECSVSIRVVFAYLRHYTFVLYRDNLRIAITYANLRDYTVLGARLTVHSLDICLRFSRM